MPTSRQVLGIRALACGELKLRPLGRKAVRGSGPAGADNGDRTGGVVQHGLAHRSEQQYFFQAPRAGAAGYVLIRNYLNRVRLGQDPGADPDRPRGGGPQARRGGTLLEGDRRDPLHQRQNGRAAPANMLQKLGLRDRLELARHAIRAGLIEP